MADEREDIDRELHGLEAELRQLEAEYTMFFAGRLPRPPWETRARVESVVKRLDRRHIANYGQRFRFSTLQARLAKFVDLWDRALRAREEGRPGPFSGARAPAGAPPARTSDPSAAPGASRVMHVTTLTDPAREQDKLRALYNSLAEARREAGQKAIPFEKFAELVSSQVSALQQRGGRDVAFRVALKDGKVALTARAVKGDGE